MHYTLVYCCLSKSRRFRKTTQNHMRMPNMWLFCARLSIDSLVKALWSFWCMNDFILDARRVRASCSKCICYFSQMILCVRWSGEFPHWRNILEADECDGSISTELTVTFVSFQNVRKLFTARLNEICKQRAAWADRQNWPTTRKRMCLCFYC
jgi:hypothetical protein